MDIQSLINEEIAEYITKLDKQKKVVDKTVRQYELEQNEERKLKKGLRAEMEKQKMFTLQAKFLKEKVTSSKQRQTELQARLDVVRKSKM